MSALEASLFRLVEQHQVTRALNRPHNQLDLSLMLGHVIAHELGHLLLPHEAHSVAGVMRPGWDRAQVRDAAQGLLTFTPDQAALIRARLQNVSETTARR